MTAPKIITETDAWPFADMEVGEWVICTKPGAQKAAHVYGNKLGRRFTTRTINNKVTGEQGVRIERLRDDAPVRGKETQRGRRPTPWPFYDLKPGGTWTCRKPEQVQKIMSAVNNHNRRIGRKEFSIRTESKDYVYSAIYVTRLG
jgi:hypothetical protein